MKILIENKEMPLKILKYSRNKMESVGCKAIAELIKEKNALDMQILSLVRERDKIKAKK